MPTRMLDLVVKDLKEVITNTFKELKQVIIITPQIGNFNREKKKLLKKPNRNSGVKKHKNKNEKFKRLTQQ